MHRYHLQNPSLLPATQVPDPLITHSGGRAPPAQFVLQHSYTNRHSHQDFTVDAEFHKYVSGDLISHQSNILKFWEVRPMLLNRTMTHALIGQ